MQKIAMQKKPCIKNLGVRGFPKNSPTDENETHTIRQLKLWGFPWSWSRVNRFLKFAKKNIHV